MPVEQDIRGGMDADQIDAGFTRGPSPSRVSYDEDSTPRRPRRRLLTPVPVALFGVILMGLGFIAGVHIEKDSGSSASAGAGGSAGFPSRSAASGSAAGTSASSRTGSASGGPPGASSASQGTSGTLAFVSGSTLYVTKSAGNTVKVLTSSGTTVTKTVKVKAGAIRPGEELTITGATSSTGAVTAAAITVGSLNSAQFPSTTSSASTSKTTGQASTALFGAG